ncbi:MAG: FkbM family methyltransferase [Bacteroidia bacterium]|nr:FkbM family methyltransferase [Bacteroidia bacterium]
MIKRGLYGLLGPARYLRVVSKTFFFLLKHGWLKGQPAFFNHYLVDHLVSEGDHVIDIGANLGYYTVLFSDRVGSSGKVWAVEPVALFREVLLRNVGFRTNVEILPFALGEESGREIEMGIPSGHRNFRHGLTHVLKEGEKDGQTMVFKATMKHPMDLFGSLQRLDFIKCDVEGYEEHIIPLLTDVLRKFHPVVQLETSGTNRTKMIGFFQELGYRVFGSKQDCLHPLMQGEATHYEGDLIFMHPDRSSRFKNIIRV